MQISQDYLNTIIDELNMMVVVISKENTLISANKVMLDFAGVSLEEVLDIPLWDLPWLKNDAELQNKLLFAITDSYMGKTSRFNASYVDASGEDVEIDFIVKPVMKDGEPEYFITMSYNITELVNARKALTEKERRVNAFFDYSNEGYFFLSLPDKVNRKNLSQDVIQQILDHFKLEDFNNRLCDILGQEVSCVPSLFEHLTLKEEIKDKLALLVDHGTIEFERTIDTKDGKKHLFIMLAGVYYDNQFEGCFGIVRDITEEKNNLDQITYLANKDYLTGINNRRNFFYEGQRLFEKCQQKKQSLVVVMFDIDHFKKVNDTYGHDAGDVVIRDIAQMVDHHICDECVLGRYGGEEYIVLIPHDMNRVYRDFDDIRIKIDNSLFDMEHKPVHVTISLGLYLLDFETDTLESGITKADKALYESKSNGRNQSTIFIESIHGESAQDPLTGLFTEESMKYKLTKSLYDVKAAGDSLWLIYFKIDVMKEDRLLTEQRHYKTMALCLKKSVRASDYVGRMGKYGFMVVIRNVNVKQVEDKHKRMLENFEIGFSGMLNNVVNVKSSILNATQSPNIDYIINKVNKNLQLL